MNCGKEHNLSVIIPGSQRGKKYKEWQSEQSGSAWKTQIRKDINFCIKSVSTYEEFLLLMRAKGYEIKGETFEEEAAKYISFRPMKQKSELTSTYKDCEKEVSELKRKQENLNQYLGKDMPTTQDIKNRQQSL